MHTFNILLCKGLFMWKTGNKKFLKSIFTAVIAFIFLFPIHGCAVPSKNDTVSKTGFVFNTVVTVTLYNTDREDIALGCFDILREMEKELSRTDPESALCQINESGGGLMPNHLKAALTGSLSYCNLTGESLDISIGGLTKLWDFSSGEHNVPSPEEIALALETTGTENITVSGDNVALASGCQIDLGAVAKGYAADILREYLEENGVESAIIDLGGNILCVGEKPGGGSFNIGIKYPFQDGTIANVYVTGKSVVTSGVYERYFYDGDQLYHHILDPKTGYPCENGLLSVTIISDSSFTGDCLSTGCFVLGLEDGLKLLNSMPDVYGIFVTDTYEVVLSDGLEDNFDITVNE